LTSPSTMPLLSRSGKRNNADDIGKHTVTERR